MKVKNILVRYNILIGALFKHYFTGASSLHLAIAYNNNELVQDLIEAGANVNQRAIGKHFRSIF